MNKEVQVHPRIALIVGFLLVFLMGYSTGKAGYSVHRAGNSLSVVKQSVGQPSDVDFSLFWDSWNLVKDKYVKPVDDKERLYGAIAGQVASLGDPYSAFLKPQENERFTEELSGNFEGIGAELVQKDGFVTVVTPLEGSPAASAGLQPDDIIVKIDDQDVPSSLEEAVKKIRGKKGTKVKLTVSRSNKLQDFTITRDVIQDKSVSYTKKDNVGVIKVSQFSGNTTQLLDESLEKAKNDGVKSIVLDLRNNPGGLLNVSVELVSRFMEPGVVVYERGKDGQDIAENTVNVKERNTLPMVVLVNKGSASASEITAGALQDAGRAKIVGEVSFGKGSVQSIEPLKDGSSIKVTIAEWLTPKKREINKVGVKPDVEVSLTEDDAKNKRDPQLDKALDLLK